MSSLVTEKFLSSFTLFNTSVPISLALSSVGKVMTVSTEGTVGWYINTFSFNMIWYPHPFPD